MANINRYLKKTNLFKKALINTLKEFKSNNNDVIDIDTFVDLYGEKLLKSAKKTYDNIQYNKDLISLGKFLSKNIVCY